MKTLGVVGASVAAAVGAAVAVSCGSSSGPTACGGCGCGDGAPATTTIDVPFVVCGDASADAGGDASADAGDAAARCFVTCADACAASYPGSVCVGTSDEGGEVVAECEVAALCTGRKLAGLHEPVVRAPTARAANLARMAWLEAASVRAFERLARELRFHGAPRSLVRRARESARDEARHARIMARLARKHGARVPRVVVERGATCVRDLESVVRENAVEACVGETFGAAQAALGARSADPDFARAMGAIAPDELRHAELGWAVAAWAERELSPDARARVRAARDAAVAELLQNARTSPRDRAMAEELRARLWAA